MKTKHAGEFLRHLRNKKYEKTPEGLYFPVAKALVTGEYVHDVNGQDERVDKNLITDEGLIYLLSAGVANGTRYATWYLSLYAANYTPLPGLTAASYPATASEITSTTEGYTEATRQVWTPGAMTTPSIDNVASKAAFTIATASSLAVNGAAMHSHNTRGGVTGVCISATKFSATRTLYNTDAFNLGYRLNLTST